MAVSGGPITLPKQGTFLVGEYLRSQTVVRNGPNGEFGRVQVKMLVGGEYPRTVEYPVGRVPFEVEHAERGDVVALEVYPRAYKDRVYWQGVVDGVEDGK